MDDVPQGSIMKSTVTIVDDFPIIGENDGIQSTIYHPHSREVNKKVINSKTGTHTIISSVDGIYKVWVEPTKNLFSILPNKELRVTIKILNEREIDQKLLKSLSVEDLKESREILMKLMTKTSDILIEQEYEQKKEELFTDYHHSLDNKIFWLTFVQIAIVIGAGFWIVFSLKKFMKR